MYPQNPRDLAKLRAAESPRLRRAWASRTRRRLYTLLYAGLVLAGATLLGAVDGVMDLTEGEGLFLAALGLVVLVGMLFLVIRMNHATRVFLPYRLLDERQRADRDAAFRFSQRAMSVVLVVLFLAIALVITYSTPSPEFSSWAVMPLLWTLVMFHSSAPACYLAWTQPDEILDEEELEED